MNEIRSNWPAKETLTIEITDVNLWKKLILPNTIMRT